MKEQKDPFTLIPYQSVVEQEDNMDADDLLMDEDNDDILFDKAEVIAPNEMMEIVERVTESGSAWPAENFSRWAYPSPSSDQLVAHDPADSTGDVSPMSSQHWKPPVAPMVTVSEKEIIPSPPKSGLMDTIVQDDTALLAQLLAQQETSEPSPSPLSPPAIEQLVFHHTSLIEDSPVNAQEHGGNGSSGHNLSSVPSETYYRDLSVAIPPHPGSLGADKTIPVAVSPDKTLASVSSQAHLEAYVPVRDPNPLLGADFDEADIIEKSQAFSLSDTNEISTKDPSVRQSVEVSRGHPNPGPPVVVVSSPVASRPSPSVPPSPSSPALRPGPWSSEQPGVSVGSHAFPPSEEDAAGYETLPLHAMNQSARSSLDQQPGVSEKYKQQFEHVIDALSREGIGSREEVRDSLRQITHIHYELLHATGVHVDESYLQLVAEEQEALWEQLCAHVDLYKDFLYQSLSELDQWRLSDDCCPNLLCRAPREKGHSLCRRCQSEFFLLCPSCKNQTPYFSERCQQIQCGKPIPGDEKLNAAVKITNAYAQRQGKATVAAAAAFVLYYLMERFSITTRGDWFDQIDRYRKLQAKVNQEYQRRCLAAYQDELTRILAPAYEKMRQETFKQVGELYAESRFLDSLETLNAMPSVLRNHQVEEIRDRIYERLTEGELDHIEALMHSGQLDEATRLLQDLTFESPRRQLLVERSRQILQEKKQQIRREQHEQWGSVLFLVCLAAGSVLHWKAMPSFVGKESWGWLSPYLLLLVSGGWLLRRRTVDVARAQWLLGQTVSVTAMFGGILFVLLGLLFSSWYLTVPGSTATLSVGYRLAPPDANILSVYHSWRVISQVAAVGGVLGLFSGAIVGAILGASDRKQPRILAGSLAGAVGVSLGVALISAIGISVGSAISLLVVNTFVAAVVVASITAAMVSIGVEVGLKVASDMGLQRHLWAGLMGAIMGALIGALFGAGIVQNGMNPQIKLLHPDIAWVGFPVATGVFGAVLFVFVMLRSRGTQLRTLRWTVTCLWMFGSVLTWWGFLP